MNAKQIKAGRITKSMNFNEKVWTLCSRVPQGKVTTYGQIAQQLDTRAYRAVGNALNRNPYMPMVPCHRVVGSNGALTGYAGGLPKKRAMLQAEGISFQRNKVDLDKHLFTWAD